MSAGATVRDQRRTLTIALVGNPNSGKTTLFNALTGLRQKVGNYPGVTVERRLGRAASRSADLAVIDLPGTYSLADRSPDERVTVDVVFGRLDAEHRPDLIVNICDVSNLARNLFLTTQCLETGVPVVVALTMVDLARSDGRDVDPQKLEEMLGVPVVAVVAHKKVGLDRLTDAIDRAIATGPAKPVVKFPEAVGGAVERLQRAASTPLSFGAALQELLRELTSEDDSDPRGVPLATVQKEQAALAEAGISWWKIEAEERYRFIDQKLARFVGETSVPSRWVRFADRIDAVLLNAFAGPAIFIAVMAVIFQAVFSWSEWPITQLENGVEALSAAVGARIGPGPFHDLLTDGIISGVGNVLVFLPQILMLFIALGILEDSGYLARAAVIMDRLMRSVGLQGKSFVPLLSSFSCAIPGVMATRSIENKSARLVTILIAPLLSCSARLPVYTLVVGAFFGGRKIFGFVSSATVVMVGLYFFGIAVAVLMAFIFRKTIARGAEPSLVLELPPYRRPSVRAVLKNALDRGKVFVARAGSVILGLSVILWFLQAYPKDRVIIEKFAAERGVIEAELGRVAADSPEAAAISERLTVLDGRERSEQLRQSYAGRIGRAVEPLIRPLGFDWRIGIGLVASFAAREVLVSTLAIVFDVSDDEDQGSLRRAISAPPGPGAGEGGYSALTALSLLVFFVLACQCISTVAVVRRETNSWKWAIFLLGYMTALAWVASFVVYQGGRLLGY